MLGKKQLEYIVALVVIFGVLYTMTRAVTDIESTQKKLDRNDIIITQKIKSVDEQVKLNSASYRFLEKSLSGIKGNIDNNSSYLRTLKNEGSDYVSQKEFQGFKEDYGRGMTVMHQDHQDTNKELFNQQRQMLMLKCCRKK